MTNQTCKCAEMTLINADGSKTPLYRPDYPGARHDCDEVRRRNSFLLRASATAHAQAGNPESNGYGNRYTRFLSIEMDRLCKE